MANIYSMLGVRHSTAAPGPAVLLLCMSNAHSYAERSGCHSTPWTPWLGTLDFAYCFLMSPGVSWFHCSGYRTSEWHEFKMPANLWRPIERCRKIVIGTNNCCYFKKFSCKAKIYPKLPCYMLPCSCLQYSIQLLQNHTTPSSLGCFGQLCNTILRLQPWVDMGITGPLPGLPGFNLIRGWLPKSLEASKNIYWSHKKNWSDLKWFGKWNSTSAILLFPQKIW